MPALDIIRRPTSRTPRPVTQIRRDFRFCVTKMPIRLASLIKPATYPTAQIHLGSPILRHPRPNSVPAGTRSQQTRHSPVTHNHRGFPFCVTKTSASLATPVKPGIYRITPFHPGSRVLRHSYPRPRPCLLRMLTPPRRTADVSPYFPKSSNFFRAPLAPSGGNIPEGCCA
jgi:hypothetical protein